MLYCSIVLTKSALWIVVRFLEDGTMRNDWRRFCPPMMGTTMSIVAACTSGFLRPWVACPPRDMGLGESSTGTSERRAGRRLEPLECRRRRHDDDVLRVQPRPRGGRKQDCFRGGEDDGRGEKARPLAEDDDTLYRLARSTCFFTSWITCIHSFCSPVRDTVEEDPTYHRHLPRLMRKSCELDKDNPLMNAANIHNSHFRYCCCFTCSPCC